MHAFNCIRDMPKAYTRPDSHTKDNGKLFHNHPDTVLFDWFKELPVNWTIFFFIYGYKAGLHTENCMYTLCCDFDVLLIGHHYLDKTEKPWVPVLPLEIF